MTVAQKLRSAVEQVDNLSDREEQKLARMTVRFGRVREFLDYLQREEEGEQKRFNLAIRRGVWAQCFVPSIRQQIEREITWIERRLKENRERFVEDVQIESEGEDVIIEGEGEEDVKLE